MRREVCDVAFLLSAAADLLAIAAVLGSEHLLLLLRVEVTVRPAKIVAPLHMKHLLGGKLGALLSGVELRPVRAAAAELIAAMLHDIQIAIAWIDRDRNRVANAAGEVLALSLGLVQLAGIEAPDAGACLELGAWIDTRNLELAI